VTAHMRVDTNSLRPSCPPRQRTRTKLMTWIEMLRWAHDVYALRDAGHQRGERTSDVSGVLVVNEQNKHTFGGFWFPSHIHGHNHQHKQRPRNAESLCVTLDQASLARFHEGLPWGAACRTTNLASAHAHPAAQHRKCAPPLAPALPLPNAGARSRCATQHHRAAFESRR